MTIRTEKLLDLVILVGAVATICFSIGSIFFDGTAHFASQAPPHVVKAYRKDVSAAQP
jgi:hypothetical protein